MPCEECARARVNPDHHRVFDPACLWCGARYVQRLRRLNLTKKALDDWRKKVLDTWEAHGHDRTSLRDLALEKALPVEPEGRRKA